MTEFSSSKIILHNFHVDKKGDSDIGYDIIIVNDLIAKLDLFANFKHQLLQWYGDKAPMKKPRSLIEKT